MTDENRFDDSIDRRSVLKGAAVATAGTGALVGFGSGSVAAADYMADNPDSDHVKVRRECSGDPCDLVPNGECGTYLDYCYDDNNNKLLWIDWHSGTWKDGWVLEDHLSYC